MNGHARGRARKGSRVSVNVDDMEKLLFDMALVNADGDPLKGVLMHGTVKSMLSWSHFSVALDAGGDPEEAFPVTVSKVQTLSAGSVAPTYYVVVNEKVIEVCGLILPAGVTVAGYHTDRNDAIKDLDPASSKTVPASAPVVSAPAPIAPPTTVTTTSNTINTTRTPLPPPTTLPLPTPTVSSEEKNADTADSSIEEEDSSSDADESSEPSVAVSVRTCTHTSSFITHTYCTH